MRGRMIASGTKDERRGNFISFILLHLKAVIYARGEVRRNAPAGRARGDERATAKVRACRCARGRGTNVAIIIDMLACKRCLLYVCQSAVVVAIFQGRASSFAAPESNGGVGRLVVRLPEVTSAMRNVRHTLVSRLFTSLMNIVELNADNARCKYSDGTRH